jgi:hypothetical protein
MNRSLDLGMMSTAGFRSPPDKVPNCRNPLNVVPNPSPQILILHINREQQQPTGWQQNKVSIRLPKPRPDHAGLSKSTNLKTYHSTLGDSQGTRQSILVGLAKVCAALAPNMQFYFYRIDMKVWAQNHQGHLPCCSAKKNGDSSKAWS